MKSILVVVRRADRRRLVEAIEKLAGTVDVIECDAVVSAAVPTDFDPRALPGVSYVREVFPYLEDHGRTGS